MTCPDSAANLIRISKLKTETSDVGDLGVAQGLVEEGIAAPLMAAAPVWSAA
jgi:hypothetical protein